MQASLHHSIIAGIMQRLHILVTNDDGIQSEGLPALRGALSPIGDVSIIAPERNWSVSGHSKTMDRPLRVREVELADGQVAFATDGTPSDCVSLGVLGFLPRKPHLVVSGINMGANLGEDITYSGTVAAAMESLISGLPAIAVSLTRGEQWDFGIAADFTAHVLRSVEQYGIGGDVLLNVNVPNVPAELIAGVEVTRLGKRLYQDKLIERVDPYGRNYYWIGGERPGGEAGKGTDIAAISQNRISVTPIHLDLTSHRLISTLKKWGLDDWNPRKE